MPCSTSSVLTLTARDFLSMKARLSMPLLWKLPGSATQVRRMSGYVQINKYQPQLIASMGYVS